VIGVRVALEVAQPQGGDRLIGTLRIENHGDQSVRIASPRSAAAFNVVVFDRLWNAVEPDPRGKVNVGDDQVALEPGDVVSFELEDLAFTSGTARFAYRLPPGRHFVVAIYHPGTSRLPDESSYPAIVTSNVASIDVR
jgi:hypothetical protein